MCIQLEEKLQLNQLWLGKSRIIYYVDYLYYNQIG